MKSKTSIQTPEMETEREPTNAYEVLMPRPRTSTSPKKHESPRPLPEDELQKKIAKENRASNKKHLEAMSINKIKKSTNSRLYLFDKNVKKSRIVMLPSESEGELSDNEFVDDSKPKKGKGNIIKRKLMSDSESDGLDSPKKTSVAPESQLHQTKLNLKPQSSTDLAEDNSKKRNSLLNYFNSVSREEAKKTAELIKVKAHIHSPPTTPGRKPLNKKSPLTDSPRRSARMRLSYEPCDEIEVISSEVITAPKTPLKISTKKPTTPKVESPKRNTTRSPTKSPLKTKEPCDQIEVISPAVNSAPKTPLKISVKERTASKVETPKRSTTRSPTKSPLKTKEPCGQIEGLCSLVTSAPKTPLKISVKERTASKIESPKRRTSRSPTKSPLKIKEKPEYVKNLKLKIKAPIKTSATTGVPGDKFILSPEALDELFLSPNPKSKVDKQQKKQKKRKRAHSAQGSDADSSKSPKKVITTPRKSPRKVDPTGSEVPTNKSIATTLRNSPRTKKVVAALSKSSPKRSPNKSNVKGSMVTPKKKVVTTPKNSPRTKVVPGSALQGKSSSSKKSTTNGKSVTPRKTFVTTPKRSPRTKIAVSTLAVKFSAKKSAEKKISKRDKLAESDARSTQEKSTTGKSLKIIREIPLVKIRSSPKSAKSAKSDSRINGQALPARKSAFEEIMSKKKSHVSTSKGKGASANSVSESHTDKESNSSTLSKKESSKSSRSKVSSSTSNIESKSEIIAGSPSNAIRKSTRIPSSKSRRVMYGEESNETADQLPKKRKRKILSDDSEEDDDVVVLIETKSKNHQSRSAKPSAKLAPLFMKRTSSKLSEKVVEPVISEAKRLFLSSGVPECIKKIAEIHSQPEQEVLIFPTIAHVKQEDESPAWTLSMKHLELLPELDTSFPIIPKMALGVLTDQKATVNSERREPNPPLQIATYRRVLNNLKLENPNYCVIRNYKRLKSKYAKALPQPAAEKVVQVQAKRQKRVKKRKQLDVQIIEPEVFVAQEPSLVWTEKYKPMSSEDIVGNVNEVNQLKTWLESWKRFHNSEDPSYDIIKRKRSKSGSSDDFIEDDESRPEDNSQMPTNTSLIFGPCGSGKTSAVYAIAHELGFKVLEMNASSKRTGKHLLKLQEATQSHRVCPKNEATGGIATMFAQSAKQKKKKKSVVRVEQKPVDGNEDGNKMSLILIENADIIFEDEDEGFIAALATLVQSSKRPVIMVANDSFCPHLSRFIEQSLVIEMDWPNPRHLCAWLQVVSLVEGVRISADAAQRLVGRFNGDVAHCLNQLQFWTMTGGNNLETCADALPNSLKDDESSNSMPMTERVDEGTPLHDKCIELFLGNTFNTLIPYPIRWTEVWWNLAPVLSLPQPKSRRIAVEPYLKPRNPTERLNDLFSELENTVEEEQKNRTVDTVTICDEVIKLEEEQIVVEKWVSVCSQDEVESLAMLMDNLAWADEITSTSKVKGGVYDIGPCQRVWQRNPSEGISVRHDYSPCWHQEQEIAQSVAHFLVDRSVGDCLDRLGTAGGEYNVALPKQEDVRWRLEQQEADNTIVSLVPTNVLVDHRATFIDYLPMLQSVCRHENARLSTNTKRRNRFFHYLRGLGCHPSEEAVNVLCSTFDTGLWRCEARIE